MGEGGQLSVDVELDRDDLRVIAGLQAVGSQGGARWWPWGLRTVVSVGLVGFAFGWPALWLLVVPDLLTYVLWRPFARPLATTIFDGTYSVAPDGFRRASNWSTTVVAWPAVDRISRTGGHLVVGADRAVFVVPDRCFADDESREAFATAARSYRDAAIVVP